MNFLTNRRLEVKEFTITRIIIAYLHCCGVGLGGGAGDKDSGVLHQIYKGVIQVSAGI
jgi:hypothetical protein